MVERLHQRQHVPVSGRLHPGRELIPATQMTQAHHEHYRTAANQQQALDKVRQDDGAQTTRHGVRAGRQCQDQHPRHNRLKAEQHLHHPPAGVQGTGNAGKSNGHEGD